MFEEFRDWGLQHGLDLSDEQLRQFGSFQSALYEANVVMNLTRVPEAECWVRHFADSLLFQDAFVRDSAVLDIGTGPGFPAWPLACARADLRVTALDSNGKMLGFLRTRPLPNLGVVEARAEAWGKCESFDFVTGRAVAPLAVQLEISVKHCKVGGALLPLRTPADDLDKPDLHAMGLQLEAVWSRKLPGSEIERVLPIYRKVGRTDRRLPRRWAEIKAKPLDRGG